MSAREYTGAPFMQTEQRASTYVCVIRVALSFFSFFQVPGLTTEVQPTADDAVRVWRCWPRKCDLTEQCGGAECESRKMVQKTTSQKKKPGCALV